MNSSQPRKIFAGIFVLVFLTLSAFADDFAARVYTNADGTTMPFRLLAPKNSTVGDTNQYPLVMFFHGVGERGSDNNAQLKNGVGCFNTPENRDQFPCFVVVPQCDTNHRWVEMDWTLDSGTRPEKPGVAMQGALGILDQLIKELPVDTNRLYVTGLSMGGFGTWDCITRFPERFAAAVPVCGGGDETTINAQVAKVPLWTFHSIDDRIVKEHRTGNMVAAMRQFGGHPHYFEYFDLGHFSWDTAYSEKELFPWLFSQRLGQPDTYDLKSTPPVIPEAAIFPTNWPGVGPLRTNQGTRNTYYERRMKFWKSHQNDSNGVVFLGDSITQGWKSLSNDFPQLKVVNRGISGDLTRGVLYRLQPDVFDLDPTAIVLLIGTNDVDERATPEMIAENIKTILARCKAYNPKMPVIVCKVMPSSPRNNRPADKIQKINSLVDEIVNSDPQWIRCDTWAILADENGNAKKEEFPDLLHPNEAGYKKFVAALQPLFDKLNLPSKTTSGKP